DFRSQGTFPARLIDSLCVQLPWHISVPNLEGGTALSIVNAYRKKRQRRNANWVWLACHDKGIIPIDFIRPNIICTSELDLIFCDEPTSDIDQTPLVGKLVPALLDIPKEGPKDTTQQRAARKKHQSRLRCNISAMTVPTPASSPLGTAHRERRNAESGA